MKRSYLRVDECVEEQLEELDEVGLIGVNEEMNWL